MQFPLKKLLFNLPLICYQAKDNGDHILQYIDHSLCNVLHEMVVLHCKLYNTFFQQKTFLSVFSHGPKIPLFELDHYQFEYEYSGPLLSLVYFPLLFDLVVLHHLVHLEVLSGGNFSENEINQE